MPLPLLFLWQAAWSVRIFKFSIIKFIMEETVFRFFLMWSYYIHLLATKFQLTIYFFKVLYSVCIFLCVLVLRAKFNTYFFLFLTDLIMVVASIIVLSIGSNGQVFATSAIRYGLAVTVALHNCRCC